MGLPFNYLAPMPTLSRPDAGRVIHFSADEVPPQVESLGEVEALFRPSPLWMTLVNCRYVIAFLILAATAGTYVVIYQQAQIKGQLDQVLSMPVLSVFGGIGFVFLTMAVLVCRLSPDIATVLFY